MMADFWYDVVKPIFGWLNYVELTVQDCQELSRGFSHSPGLNPHLGTGFIPVAALLDTDIAGGKRLIEVLSRSADHANRGIAKYMETEWLRVQNEWLRVQNEWLTVQAIYDGTTGKLPFKREFWRSLLADAKEEFSDLLSKVEPSLLQEALSDALVKFACIAEETHSSSMARLDQCNGDPKETKAVIGRAIDDMLSRGSVASVHGLFALASGRTKQHLPAHWLFERLTKAKLYEVHLPQVLLMRYKVMWLQDRGFGTVFPQLKTASTSQPAGAAQRMPATAQATAMETPLLAEAATLAWIAESRKLASKRSVNAASHPNKTEDGQESVAGFSDGGKSPIPPAGEPTATKRKRKKKKKKAHQSKHASSGTASTVQTEAYQKAIRNGMICIPHGRLLVCGKGRSGKTCLTMSLLNLLFKGNADSTLGVELSKAVCMIEEKNGQFIWRVEEDEFRFFCLLAQKLVGEYLDSSTSAKSSPQHESTQPECLSSKEPIQPGGNTLFSSEADCNPASPDDKIEATKSTSEAECGRSATVHADSPGTSQKEFGAIAAHDTAAAAPDQPQTYDRPTDDDTSRRSRHSSESLHRGIPSDEEIQRYARQFLSAISSDVEKRFEELVKKLAFIEIWDFAGQELFAAVQHVLFSALRCAYLVVFDASEPLEDPHEPTMGVGGKEIRIPGTVGATNYDILESWLNVISQVIGKQGKAPLFIVGTKIDKIPEEGRAEKLLQIKRYIRSNAKGKFYENCIDAILFVDNTVSGSDQQDSSIVDLRRRIIESLTEQFTYPTPLTWLPVSFVLRKHAQAEKVAWLQLDDVKDIVHKTWQTSPADEPINVEDMLAFYHHLGHLRHYASNTRLRGVVFTDVHWLTNVTSLLFCPQPKEDQDRAFRDQYDLLEERGILTESLAQLLWRRHGDQTQRYTESKEDRDIIFSVMEEFSLLYDTEKPASVSGTNEVTRKFFVPSMVSRKLEKPIELVEAEKSPPIYLYCGERLLFPETLFWCVVVRTLQHYSPSDDPVLYHTAAEILCYDTFHVVFQVFQNGIRVSVEIPKEAAVVGDDDDEDDEKPTSIPEMCDELLPFLEDALSDLKSNGLEHIDIQRAVVCRCSENNKPCARHKRSRCEELDCSHFIPLIDKKRPRCPRSRIAQDESQLAEFWPIPMMKKAARAPSCKQPVDTEDGPAVAGGCVESAGSVDERAQRYRDAMQKHAPALETRLDGLAFAKLLRAEGFLTASQVDEVRAKAEYRGACEAVCSLLAAVEKMDDDMICHFVEEMLIVEGKVDILRTLQHCSGPRACKVPSKELHK